MNKVILRGRLTKDPVIRYSQDNSTFNARYKLAVDRGLSKEYREAHPEAPTADFISCIAWNKAAEFAEKNLKKGTMILIEGRIQTDSYPKDGQTIYTTDVVVERHEFCESKNANAGGENSSAAASDPTPAPADEPIPGLEVDDLELPFK